MANPIYEGAAKYNLIYIFEINDEHHKGYLKIGKASLDTNLGPTQLPPNCDILNQAAISRINEYTKTAMIPYKLLYTELAVRISTLEDGTAWIGSFVDDDVHEVLDRSWYKNMKFYDTGEKSEWYEVTLPVAINAIKAVKQFRTSLTVAEMGVDGAKVPDTPVLVYKKKITLRDEQEACVQKTQKIFAENDRMLWDCKMRFGKTVTAYSLVKRMNYQKVLVVTHRPAVVDGWSADFKLIFDDNDDRCFVTKNHAALEGGTSEAEAQNDLQNDIDLRNLAKSGKAFVYFASMQDLRGSRSVGGKFNKNQAVFDMDWDLIIYDEAHEGTQTELGLNVQALLEEPKKGKSPKKVLQLSGTPYNLLNQYEDDNVFSWTYVDEQKAKKNWEENHPGEHNPYGDLPEMRICTFDLRDCLAGSYRFETEDLAFNFREFFRTWTGDPKIDYRTMPEGTKIGDFVHEADVNAFLDLISDDSVESNYPFSKQEYRDLFRHTFWLLPGVKEASAMSALLQKHKVFKKYKVANVAGAGDVEEPYDDALKKVRETIEHNGYTITLSCGKLTTGVTVKEWTGAMMLSGSSSTAAAGYMQTIFRVQSAGSVNGKQKSVCYAFDFAPDRALRVLSEVHKLQKAARSGDEEGRVQLGEFLNFCPVLAADGTGMKPYDVPQLMQQIKRLTVDNAIKSGFDDDSIYKEDACIVIDKAKLQLMKILEGRVSAMAKSKKKTKVDINTQGMTGEEYAKAEKAKNKPKKERTHEEEAAIREQNALKKQQQYYFSLLRNISIRLPLLIYGAKVDFSDTIHMKDFVDIVDDESWQEFMPKLVDKTLFKKLLVFYDEDVIEGAGFRIRRLAKAADELPPTQRVIRIAEIFSYFRNPDKETVLTPWRVVNMHLGETLGGYNFYKEGYPNTKGVLETPRLIEQGEVTSNLFLNKNVKVLEMNSKSGLYPLYMAYSLYRMNLTKEESEMTLEEQQAVWQRVLKEHLYVLCKTKMACAITQRTLAGYNAWPINTLYLTKLLTRMEDPKKASNNIRNPKLWGLSGDDKLKFDAIVGNPPYQLMNDGDGYGSNPVYHMFFETAMAVGSCGTFIHPARFLFNAGKTPKEWNEKMLHNKHYKVVKYWDDSSEIFPSVDIKGGVAITFWDFGKDFGEIGAFMPQAELRLILSKLKALNPVSLASIVYPRDLYRLNDCLYKENPWAIERPSKGHKFDVGSNTFNIFPELFNDERPDTNEEYAQILGRAGTIRQTKWIKNSYLKVPDNFESYKVFVAKANGTGALGEALSTLEIGIPNMGHTVTFLSIGKFDTQQEAENLKKYICTKFARIMLGTLKVTQDNPHDTWLNVPMQDFSPTSDIDWSKSVSDIDLQLYSKYNLSPEEIDFIEKTAKTMI